MNNEIEEILDRFYDEYPKEIKILEDYITNLQQRIDKAIDYINDIDEPELRVIEEMLRGDE